MKTIILEKLKNKFRVLKDWEIEFDNNSKYKGQVNFNTNTKKAVVYDWENKSEIPKDFILHEILHIAFVASNTREKEELFIQDLCKALDEQRETFYANELPKIEKKIKEQQRNEMIKEIEKMSNFPFPKMKNEEYEMGYMVCQKEIIKKIKGL